jgi:hypothetical protein
MATSWNAHVWELLQTSTPQQPLPVFLKTPLLLEQFSIKLSQRLSRHMSGCGHAAVRNWQLLVAGSRRQQMQLLVHHLQQHQQHQQQQAWSQAQPPPQQQQHTVQEAMAHMADQVPPSAVLAARLDSLLQAQQGLCQQQHGVSEAAAAAATAAAASTAAAAATAAATTGTPPGVDPVHVALPTPPLRGRTSCEGHCLAHASGSSALPTPAADAHMPPAAEGIEEEPTSSSSDGECVHRRAQRLDEAQQHKQQHPHAGSAVQAPRILCYFEADASIQARVIASGGAWKLKKNCRWGSFVHAYTSLRSASRKAADSGERLPRVACYAYAPW